MVAVASTCIHGLSAERRWNSIERTPACPYCAAKERGELVHAPAPKQLRRAACGAVWTMRAPLTLAAPPHLQFVTCAACRALAETPTPMTQEKPMTAETASNTTVGAPTPNNLAHEELRRPGPSLVRKLAEVMGEVHRVAKNGRNDFHKYDYAKESDVAEAVRTGMAERHLMLVPDVKDTKWREVPGRNGPQQICTLFVRFSVHDGDTGEVMEFNALGEGQDSGDKATYKAMTGAVKYALMKLFLIPTGDDPENEGPPQQKRQGKPQPQERRLTPEQERAGLQQVKENMKKSPTDELVARIAAVKALDELEKLFAWAHGKQSEKNLYGEAWDKVLVKAFDAQREKIGAAVSPEKCTEHQPHPTRGPCTFPKGHPGVASYDVQVERANPASGEPVREPEQPTRTAFEVIMETFDQAEAKRDLKLVTAAGQAIRTERKAQRLTTDEVKQLTNRGEVLKKKLAAK